MRHRLYPRSSQPYRLSGAVLFPASARADAAAYRRRRQPQHAPGRFRATALRRFLPAPQFQGGNALHRRLQRISASVAVTRLSARIFHRRRTQPQRPDTRSENRHPRHDHCQLPPRTTSPAGIHPGLPWLRKADRRQYLSARTGRPAEGKGVRLGIAAKRAQDSQNLWACACQLWRADGSRRFSRCPASRLAGYATGRLAARSHARNYAPNRLRAGRTPECRRCHHAGRPDRHGATHHAAAHLR